MTSLTGKRVLLTGHTGFKGAWLAEWLLAKGADLTGIALLPEQSPSLFEQLDLAKRMNHVVCDVRDHDKLAHVVAGIRPNLVLHLAAQALVRRSYAEPRLTWDTNVCGTLNLLEALRAAGSPCTVVAVTTDKVYKNREWEYPYRETDELGGHDPYSSSKAGAELAVASWRSSYAESTGIRVVTARAGNVIGPGDYSLDRIVPDCYRAWGRGDVLSVRSPGSTRPWQHVLEPLAGYLALAAHVEEKGAAIETCNFGPGTAGDRSVGELVEAFTKRDPSRKWSHVANKGPHEARALSLCIDRAMIRLGWTPRLSFEEMIAWTDEGYVAGWDEMPRVVRDQIARYEARLGSAPT